MEGSLLGFETGRLINGNREAEGWEGKEGKMDKRFKMGHSEKDKMWVKKEELEWIGCRSCLYERLLFPKIPHTVQNISSFRKKPVLIYSFAPDFCISLCKMKVPKFLLSLFIISFTVFI